MSSSRAVSKRVSRDAQAIMAPPPRPKRIKRPTQVLDEDTYTDALSHIIARDFFPGLAETEAQQEYLDSLHSRDKEWIASAGQRLHAVMTPGPDGRWLRGRRGTSMTPTMMGSAVETPKQWIGDTPAATAEAVGPNEEQTPKVDTNMSLGAFQAKYTSEDNESFNKLLDKQNEQRAQKYAWMWNENKIPAARQIAYRKRQEAIEASKTEQESEDGKQVLRLKTSDKRKAMPDTWKSRPDNNLMFEPASIEDEMPSVQQNAERASRAGPKAVVFENTRMPAPSDTDSSKVPESPSLSAVNDAIAGRPRFAASEMSEFGGGETPRVNGYAFVDSEPSPEPESSGPSDIDWSKLPLGPGDAMPNPFDIKEQSSRENLHHRMVDKVARGKRAEQIASQSKTPVPRFMSSPRVAKGGLTPAGQRLFGNVGGGKTPRGSVWESSSTPKVRSGLGASWTPKKPATKKDHAGFRG